MSRIYTIGASRNVNKAYKDFSALKDSKMKHIERMTRLIGTIATRVMFVDDNMPHFDYQPIYYFHPFFGDDPFKPIAISYPLMNYTDDVSNSEICQYIHWNEEIYIIFLMKVVVFWHKKNTDMEFYLLYLHTENINAILFM